MDFAGWYPADAEACRRLILDYRKLAAPASTQARLGLAPHAGWTYSGRLAAAVFEALAGPEQVELVIVLGGHLGAAEPILAMVEGSWQTPFGEFTIHGGFREALAAFTPAVLENEAGYSPDNSTEVLLPLAKFRYPQAELLPIRVPAGPLAIRLGQALADYLERNRLKAAAVASTDLTHYGPNYRYEPKGRGALDWVRRENDPAFIRALETGESQAILAVADNRRNACSAGAAAALNELARASGLRFHTLGYATSADVAPHNSVNFVGYLAGIYR